MDGRREKDYLNNLEPSKNRLHTVSLNEENILKDNGLARKRFDSIETLTYAR